MKHLAYLLHKGGMTGDMKDLKKSAREELWIEIFSKAK